MWEDRVLSRLPDELQYIIRSHPNGRLFAIADALCEAKFTDTLLPLTGDVLPAFCSLVTGGDARGTNDVVRLLGLYSRILPFAPYLAEQTQTYLDSVGDVSQHISGQQREYLLALLRLLNFNHQHFSKYVRIDILAALRVDKDACVRYLAAQVLCLRLRSAEATTNQIVESWLGGEEPVGQWDGREINYRFLPIWEAERQGSMHKQMTLNSHEAWRLKASDVVEVCGPDVILLGDTILPRKPKARPPRPSVLVLTPTAIYNQNTLAQALKQSDPILIRGPAGSGKSVILQDAANKLGRSDDMITIHLNEQSDAKTLIGIYTTGEEPGSFVWRPGVLTKAVTEGRWVLIEDMDRAPNEVISVLLPLIERQELTLPGSNQVTRASVGFRLLATVRTDEDQTGRVREPTASMLGRRLWRSVRFETPKTDEVFTIISDTFPGTSQAAHTIVAVYSALSLLQSDPRQKRRSSLLRPVSLREVLKWAARISTILQSKTAMTIEDEGYIFLAAVDCFAGHIMDVRTRGQYVSCIAEHCRVDPQRRDHLLSGRTIAHVVKGDHITIGPYRFLRSAEKSLRTSRSKNFSANPHTSKQLEKIAAALKHGEPLLLVGETGTGKTTSIQYMCDALGKRLVPFNLSQQSESSDMLGGFKPVSTRTIILPLQEEFHHLFTTSFTPKVLTKNQSFLDLLSQCVMRQQWQRVCKCWHKAKVMVDGIRGVSPTLLPASETHPAKKRRTEARMPLQLSQRWDRFFARVEDVEIRLTSGTDSTIAFAFVEGSIVKAAREGDWVLLDEVNLATPETLEALSDLLDKEPSIMLSEAGSAERIQAHPEFRVFAAMNPATDVGKKELPLGIRSRFTELYVDSPDTDLQSLQQIVQTYLGPNELPMIEMVSRLHQDILRLCDRGDLIDGAGQKAHFSLRTLTRTLLFVKDVAGQCSLKRALHEGFSMSYLTLLDSASEQLLITTINQYLYGRRLKDLDELEKPMMKPQVSEERGLVKLSRYWLTRGPLACEPQSQYIMTDFVKRNLNKLMRAAMTKRFPILLQGPTSSGKTSMVEYLAKETGHRFIRINNHEHTDLQEYLGSYVSATDGKLVFQEGLLVQALRNGHWIVLDELNLAPTEVLEALNRLLDDNRELMIPETQEIVRPHPDFMLFATQNPAGIYGGRKMLSRAFRNRFLELHFDDIPINELDTILQGRADIAPSWSRLIVNVYKELSMLRQQGKVFEQKGFATLRDLFRWALRPAVTKQDLAENGYMILGERCRKFEERREVKAVIERVLSTPGPRVSIDEDELYDRLPWSSLSSEVVWTKAMRRLYTLVDTAIKNNEPVLLVGDTGCGKTTVCQVLAQVREQKLRIVNAHENTETGDLIGAQRPVRNRSAIEAALRNRLMAFEHTAVQDALSEDKDPDAALIRALKLVDSVEGTLVNGHRNQLQDIQKLRVELNKLFEWADGSVVQAMKQGDLFLLDEISLADDSVLERLNSVLEPARTIMLAEKGSVDSFVKAAEGFQFFATMNPGGDYGKKELSPALRNRFTEIWVPPLSDADDLTQVLDARLGHREYVQAMIKFSSWFQEMYNSSMAASVHIRDLLAWTDFMNRFPKESDQHTVFIHGAHLIYIDGLGANPAGMLYMEAADVPINQNLCLEKLMDLLGLSDDSLARKFSQPDCSEGLEWIKAFCDPEMGGRLTTSITDSQGAIMVTRLRLIRAMTLGRPILMEGPPGVGKTSAVISLATDSGRPLIRINLSEQTDLMDLFGCDVPVEGESIAMFAWRDAPFLTALKQGAWVLLDEMNLASQSVLEGLNACLDHRGEVYVPEIDKTFQKHPDFRLFAAQNPHSQGAGRKGLPASFVNRFTVVYVSPFTSDDLAHISERALEETLPSVSREVAQKIFELSKLPDFRGNRIEGGPFEFNVRDAVRLLQLQSSNLGLLRNASWTDFVDTVIQQRFRTEHARRLAGDILGRSAGPDELFHNMSDKHYQVGYAIVERAQLVSPYLDRLFTTYDVRKHLPIVKSMLLCLQMNWPILLTGPSGCGKTELVDNLARILGAKLTVISLNSDVDASDLVGGYEQHDPIQAAQTLVLEIAALAQEILLLSSLQGEISLDTAQALQSVSEPIVSQPTALEAVRTLHDWLSRAQELIMHSDFAKKASRNRMMSLFDRCTAFLSDHDINAARFEWRQSKLIHALEHGETLVLENANLCSSAALDRLNGLFEPQGHLIVHEHTDSSGRSRVVKPHADFRVIMTMDPKHGELSRALRNRCVELSMTVNSKIDATSSGDEVSDLVMAQIDSQVQFFDSALQRLYRAKSMIAARPLHFEQVARAVIGHLHPDDVYLYDTLIREMRDHRLFLEDRSLPPFHEALSSNVNLAAVHIHVNDDTFLDVETLNTVVNSCLLESQSANHQMYSGIAARSLLSWDRDYYLKRTANILNDLQRRTEAAPLSKSAGQNSDVISCLQLLRNILVRIGQSDSHLAEPVNLQDYAENVYIFFLLAFHKTTQASARHVEEMLLTVLAESGRQIFDHCRERAIEDAMEALSGNEPDPRCATMDILWTTFQSSPSHLMQASQFTASSMSTLQDLVGQFDTACWSSGLPITEIVGVRYSLSAALAATSTLQLDHGYIEQLLEKILVSTDKGTKTNTQLPKVHFRNAFQGIAQAFDLEATSILNETPNSSVLRQSVYYLAGRSSATISQLLIVTDGRDEHAARTQLRLLSGFSGAYDTDNTLGVDSITIHADILSKLRGAYEVPVSDMSLLQEELDVLGQVIATKHHVLHENIMECIFQATRDICSRMIASLESESRLSDYENAIWTTKEGKRITFAQIMQNLRSIQVWELSDEVRPQAYGQLAAALSIICLSFVWLYMTKSPMNPALKVQYLQEHRSRHWIFLDDKVQALKEFERHFTGRQTSRMIASYEHRLESIDGYTSGAQRTSVPSETLEDIRPVMNVFQSISDVLDTHFASMINPLRGLERESPGNIETEKKWRANLLKAKQRLKDTIGLHHGLTEPLWHIMNALDLSFRLQELAVTDANDSDDNLRRLPLLGGRSLTATVAFDPLPVSLTPQQAALELLKVQLMKSLHPRQSLFQCSRRSSDILEVAYAAWRTSLDAGQVETQTRSSLYRYRGGDEQADDLDDEEIHELFSENANEKRNSQSLTTNKWQEFASQLAGHLEQIHSPHPDSQNAVISMLYNLSDQSAHQYGQNLELLPLVILALDKQRVRLDTSQPQDPRFYNIYHDPNTREMQQLITVLQGVTTRFKSVNNSWPEHAVPLDILATCHDLTTFPHTTPITKVITKVEKLHQHIHEWQTVASKEFSAGPQYDAVTNLIISWRRLELSTWSRMLDHEAERCVEDANGWFFLAYESIVEGPRKITQGSGLLSDATSVAEGDRAMRFHFEDVIKTLESFFATTGLGQFSARLRILQTLQKQLESTSKSQVAWSGQGLAATVLQNFIDFMQRYQQPIADSIAAGRKALDADMKNVIQVASWKDTNISALRQSAKKSHLKLFKVIRKFRALLGQPVGAILLAGAFAQPISMQISDLSEPSSSYGSLYTKNMAVVSEDPMTMESKTIQETLAGKLDGAGEVKTWLLDLQKIIQTLRKATPSLLTEDNKSTAQHLKVRKRKLFAEVLKTLREMGFKHNLTDDVLSTQDSFAKIMSRLSRPDDASIRLLPNRGPDLDDCAHTAILAIHQLLHWLPSVRASMRDHSDDLTGAEVGRSVALIESFLHIILQQRDDLFRCKLEALQSRSALDRLLNVSEFEDVRALDFDADHTLTVIEDKRNAIVQILEASLEVLAAQTRLAKGGVQADLRGLQELLHRLMSLEIPALRLPPHLGTVTICDFIGHFKRLVLDLRAEIDKVITQCPAVRGVLSSLQHWTDVEDEQLISKSRHSLQEVQQLLNVAVENLQASRRSIIGLLQATPVSTENPAWLIAEVQALSTTLHAVGASEVSSQLLKVQQMLHTLSGHDLERALQTWRSMAGHFTEFLFFYDTLLSRYARLHSAICQMGAMLAKIYSEMARNGFCSPREKDSAADDKDAKIEAGTGLGDGEGAEDISKDIGDDEDMTELAQENNTEATGEELENEKDAVDMADADLEGEYGDEQEKANEDDEDSGGEDQDDLDSEAGSVDDLGEGTVDEKTWDSKGEQDASKDQQADKVEGTMDNELMAGGEDEKQKEDDLGQSEQATEEELEGDEEQEGKEAAEAESADPTMQQEDNLDLPEDIDLDGSKEDDLLDDIDGLEDGMHEEPEVAGDNQDPADGTSDEADQTQEPSGETEQDVVDEEVDGGANDADDPMDENDTAKDNDDMLQDDRDAGETADDHIETSKAGGVGLDEDQEQPQEDEATGDTADRAQGQHGDPDQVQRGAGDGQQGSTEEAADHSEPTQDPEVAAAREDFRKLGNALEKWYRQQNNINQARPETEEYSQTNVDAEMKDVEFEHLPDEDADADAQALGAAREDEATALDETADTAVNEAERHDQFVDDEGNEDDVAEDVEMADVDEAERQGIINRREDDQARAFVGKENQEDLDHSRSGSPGSQVDEDDSAVNELPEQFRATAIALDSVEDLSFDEALKIWHSHEARTRTLSLQLQEQLRLILHPTQSSKLRGDFRTGKRLNIKRIIPYIASNYKRDKIWLRRSVPSKRQFQIALAVDDSQSMRDAGVGDLAFDTLALVSSALRMLEAGDLAVLGFGSQISIPVQLGDVFGPDRGAEVVRTLRFRQTGTDVRTLLQTAATMFEEAKGRRSVRGVGVWQLLLILGDGNFQDEEGVRRLERQLREQNVMAVFVIVDVMSGEDKTSIMDVQKAWFEKGELKMRKYLETFPFRYYLIVRDVAELPNVLAGALRQWFSEVAETG